MKIPSPYSPPARGGEIKRHCSVSPPLTGGGGGEGEKGFSSESKPLLVIVGPTAVGKSALAIYLAEVFNGEIISADSMQVYKGMDIGTARPSDEELARVPHHMLSIIEPGDPFSVGEYVRFVRPVIDGLHKQGKIPVVAGGTGLYVRAIVDGLCDAPEADETLREKLLQEEEQYGKGYLYKRLCEADPVSARRIKPNDTVRILRALEVYEIMGVPISEIQKTHGFREKLYDCFVIGLTMDRRKLYRNIEERVDSMIEKGLEAEVRGLMDKGKESFILMHGLGYKQIAGYIKGWYSLEDAGKLLKRDTRRYAKRQLTWFRRDDRIRWYTVKDDLSHFNVIKDDVHRELA